MEPQGLHRVARPNTRFLSSKGWPTYQDTRGTELMSSLSGIRVFGDRPRRPIQVRVGHHRAPDKRSEKDQNQETLNPPAETCNREGGRGFEGTISVQE